MFAPDKRELDEWNAGVERAKYVYERWPIMSGPATDKKPDMVPRERVDELIEANAHLAKANRELRRKLAASEAARRAAR